MKSFKYAAFIEKIKLSEKYARGEPRLTHVSVHGFLYE